MESQAKNSQECKFLDQSELNDKNILLAIGENTVESHQFISPSGNRSNLTNVLTYRIIDKAKHERNEAPDKFNFLHKSPGTEQVKSNCDMADIKGFQSFTYRIIDKVKQERNEAPDNSSFLHKSSDMLDVKGFQSDPRIVIQNPPAARNNPRPIAPKLASSNSEKRKFVIEPYKKRDEKKRATHNEVERRRRDKINSWIFKLKELIPETETSNSPTESKHKTNGTDSKSQILIRACEYIKEMQEELKSLRECLMENDNLRLSNQQVQLERDTSKSNTHSTNNVEANCEATLTENNNS